MSDTTCHMSISLDGYVAGPDQSREDPLGKRGRELHGWHIGDPRANEADKMACEWLMRPRSAYVMGRNMFGPIRGDWDGEWTGWWGPEPPYHAPVYVMTHHPHDAIRMEGGTTFHFVTDGFVAAYTAACETVDDKGVDIAGSDAAVRQALTAGVIDELTLDIAPVLLGSGERIFDGIESFDFEPAEVLHSPLATHFRYRTSDDDPWSAGGAACTSPVPASAAHARRHSHDPFLCGRNCAVRLVIAVQTREQLCGVVERIGMAMHDLPLAALASEDRRAAEHVRRRLGACYRRGRPFDSEHVGEIFAYVGSHHFPHARATVREAGGELLEHGTDLGPPHWTEGCTEDGDRIGVRPHVEAWTGVAVVQRRLGLVDPRQHLVEELLDVAHRTTSVTSGCRPSR